MVLESVLICLDSSCYMINNDYSPVRTRWMCQVESAESISRRVINGHPESVVGMLVTAGDNSTSLLSSPVRDLDVLISKCRQVSLSGQSKLVNTLNKALLVLKFRKNRNGEQRIILYVGSPIEEDSNKSALQEVGRKLKLNNISIDIVSFGDNATMERNEELLNVLKESANKEGGRSSTVVQIGRDDSFVATTDRLLAGDANEGGGGGSGGYGNSSVQFPNDFAGDNDDDLMLALRISAEEAQAAARVGNSSDSNGNSNSSSASATVTAAVTAERSVNNMDLGYIDDDELQLQEAIKMSMMNIPDSDSGSSSSSTSSNSSSAAFLASLRSSESDAAASGNDAGDDDLHAIAMSMTASSGGANELNFNLNESKVPTPSTTIHASKRLRIETPLENGSNSLGSEGNSSSSFHATSYVTPRTHLATSSPKRPSKTPNNTLSTDGEPNLGSSSSSSNSSNNSYGSSNSSNSSDSSNSNSRSISVGREQADNSDFPEFLKKLVQKVNVNPNDIAIRSTIDHLSDSNTEDKLSCSASSNASDNLDDSSRMVEEPASSNSSSNNDAESGSSSSRKRKSQ